MNHKAKPVFHRRIFWDVDFDQLDYDTRSAFVIVRVFNRGDVDDIRQCRRYYGDEKVRAVLLNTKFLMPARMRLAGAVLDEPIESFRCFKLKELNPGLYPY